MYTQGMSTDALPESLSIADARANFTDVIGAAQYAGRITHITRGRGHRPAAAVVSEEFLAEALAAMEIVEDEILGRKAIEAMERDHDEPLVSAAELRERLGL